MGDAIVCIAGVLIAVALLVGAAVVVWRLYRRAMLGALARDLTATLATADSPSMVDDDPSETVARLPLPTTLAEALVIVEEWCGPRAVLGDARFGMLVHALLLRMPSQ